MAILRTDRHSQSTHRRGYTGADLLHRLAAGDLTAFQALYDGTVKKVFGLVQAIVFDPGEAEKVTLEVYLDIWCNAAGLDTAGDDPELCVLIVAHRYAVERRRSLRAAAAGAGVARQHPTEVSRPSGLDTLDPVPGELLLLTYYSGYTCRQAATLLGLPVATAQAQLRTALRTLARSGGSDDR